MGVGGMKYRAYSQKGECVFVFVRRLNHNSNFKV
jgi:hypothetical protein